MTRTGRAKATTTLAQILMQAAGLVVEDLTFRVLVLHPIPSLGVVGVQPLPTICVPVADPPVPLTSKDLQRDFAEPDAGSVRTGHLRLEVTRAMLFVSVWRLRLLCPILRVPVEPILLVLPAGVFFHTMTGKLCLPQQEYFAFGEFICIVVTDTLRAFGYLPGMPSNLEFHIPSLGTMRFGIWHRNGQVAPEQHKCTATMRCLVLVQRNERSTEHPKTLQNCHFHYLCKSTRAALCYVSTIQQKGPAVLQAPDFVVYSEVPD